MKRALSLGGNASVIYGGGGDGNSVSHGVYGGFCYGLGGELATAARIEARSVTKHHDSLAAIGGSIGADQWEQALSLIAWAWSKMVTAHRWAQRYAAGSGWGGREVAESAVLIEYGTLHYGLHLGVV